MVIVVLSSSSPIQVPSAKGCTAWLTSSNKVFDW
jgi:hypothetical protein